VLDPLGGRNSLVSKDLNEFKSDYTNQTSTTDFIEMLMVTITALQVWRFINSNTEEKLCGENDTLLSIYF